MLVTGEEHKENEHSQTRTHTHGHTQALNKIVALTLGVCVLETYKNSHALNMQASERRLTTFIQIA